ncbi:hypothetical protein [Thalassolituus sp.]|jgi:hypothetical protein|uniref:hypothetical protein n=1 Tax=Thalassolituus sp. TaxID=2030822 RepID=UPI002A829A1B|nr:hypothetical protein [Thalassolituus sp.]
MLLNQYNQSGLLFYSNFLDETSTSGLFSYRGELVLIEGEVGDDKGHTKPPKEVLRECLLVADDKLKLVVGALDKVSSINLLVEKYKDDFAPDMKAILYIVNLKKAFQVEIEGINFVLIPMIQGVPWNETLEELALEKSHFKGQSPADKLLILLSELNDYKPKYLAATLDDLQDYLTSAVRETHGAI